MTTPIYLTKSNRVPELAALHGDARFERFVHVYWPALFRVVASNDTVGTPARWAQITDAMIGHIHQETGAGVACFCWNVGNIHALSSDVLRFHGADSLTVGGAQFAVDFRAYLTMRAGLVDYVRVIRRSPTRWGVLLDDAQRPLFLDSLATTGYDNAPDPGGAVLRFLMPRIARASAPFRPGMGVRGVDVAMFGAAAAAVAAIAVKGAV